VHIWLNLDLTFVDAKNESEMNALCTALDRFCSAPDVVGRVSLLGDDDDSEVRAEISVGFHVSEKLAASPVSMDVLREFVGNNTRELCGEALFVAHEILREIRKQVPEDGEKTGPASVMRH
jgi:hypothetical protein